MADSLFFKHAAVQVGSPGQDLLMTGNAGVAAAADTSAAKRLALSGARAAVLADPVDIAPRTLDLNLRLLGITTSLRLGRSS